MIESIIDNIICFYDKNTSLILFIKDLILLGTYIYAMINIIVYFKNKKYHNKKTEIEYDLKLRNNLEEELKEYFNSYIDSIKKNNGKDICFRTIYVKNYPYNFKVDDAYKQHFFYYLFTPQHLPSGYSSKNGLFIYDAIWIYSESLYYNEKNNKWFIDKEKLKFKNYKEIEEVGQIVYRLPYTNIVNYDFKYDGDFVEPIIYTKYKSHSLKLYANDVLATNRSIPEYPKVRIELDKRKRTHKIRLYIKNRIIFKIKLFFKTKLKRKQ